MGSIYPINICIWNWDKLDTQVGTLIYSSFLLWCNYACWSSRRHKISFSSVYIQGALEHCSALIQESWGNLYTNICSSFGVKMVCDISNIQVTFPFIYVFITNKSGWLLLPLLLDVSFNYLFVSQHIPDRCPKSQNSVYGSHKIQ